MSTSAISVGSLTPWSTQGDYNVMLFAIQQALSKMQTATLVQVAACSNSGAVAAIGTVDVTPLVNQLDALNNPTPHVTVFGLPYFRSQAGSNGIIIDPQVGDIGVAVFASRDISKVKSTQAQANPGSGRQYDFADGIYLGTVLSAAAPTQYLLFSESGLTANTPGKLVTQSSGDTDITAGGKLVTQSSGDTDITASGNIILSGSKIQAGSSPVPVCSQPLVTWVNSVLIPALASHMIVVAAPPSDALTTTFEAS